MPFVKVFYCQSFLLYGVYIDVIKGYQAEVDSLGDTRL